MTINEALENIKSLNHTQSTEIINLFEAKGRVLANDFYAKCNAPLFTNSAMDGYALKASEFKNGLKVLKTIFAGDMSECEIKSGECVKIMTGARVPKGADSVLMVENSIIKDDLMYATSDNLKVGEAIRYEGEEYKKGELIIKKGIITDEIIMILASNGVFNIEVIKEIKVGIFASGLEIIEPYSNGFGVYNSNAYGIYSAFKSFSKPYYLGVLKDEYEFVLNSLKGALDNFDLVVSIGAASVGDADFIKKALDELGFKPIFTKVKMKPAGPVSLYFKDNKYILVLPGNPMSAYIGALIYARALIYKMQGIIYEKPSFLYPISMDLKIKNNKENVVIGNIINDTFVPFNNAKLSSGQITPLNKCTHYIICPVDCDIKQNDKVRVYEQSI